MNWESKVGLGLDRLPFSVIKRMAGSDVNHILRIYNLVDIGFLGINLSILKLVAKICRFICFYPSGFVYLFFVFPPADRSFQLHGVPSLASII